MVLGHNAHFLWWRTRLRAASGPDPGAAACAWQTAGGMQSHGRVQGYYQALATVIPFLYVALVLERRLSPLSKRNDAFETMAHLFARLIVIVFLPNMQWGVLLTLRDHPRRQWSTAT